MKKYLIVFAAVALTGCAHAQYKSAYLDDLADKDCRALQAERASSELELQSLRGKRDSAIGLAFHGHQVLIKEHFGPPGRMRYQEKRLRNHARTDAILQLEVTKGCRGPTPLDA